MDFLADRLSFVVGDGRTVNSLSDRWCRDEALSCPYPVPNSFCQKGECGECFGTLMGGQDRGT